MGTNILGLVHEEAGYTNIFNVGEQNQEEKRHNIVNIDLWSSF